jgi:cellulose synthase/poly-beta-1,6-N-acetylglucosamine synthase-like glycosyltransferase
LISGYKVEYCAAVDVSIHVPETFSTYVKESQREIPLQMAAMADIVCNYSSVLACNENITIIYVGYLVMALVSAIFACGTVFLVIITSLVDLFKMNMFLALAANALPVAGFMVICIFGSPKLQVSSLLKTNPELV